MKAFDRATPLSVEILKNRDPCPRRHDCPIPSDHYHYLCLGNKSQNSWSINFHFFLTIISFLCFFTGSQSAATLSLIFYSRSFSNWRISACEKPFRQFSNKHTQQVWKDVPVPLGSIFIFWFEWSLILEWNPLSANFDRAGYCWAVTLIDRMLLLYNLGAPQSANTGDGLLLAQISELDSSNRI